MAQFIRDKHWYKKYYLGCNFVMNASVQVCLQRNLKWMGMHTNNEHGNFERDYQHWTVKIESSDLK